MKTVLITGGAGYVGSNVVRSFLDEGFKVVCIDNLKFGGETLLHSWHNEHFTFLPYDLNDHTLIETVFNDYNIDGIVHLAAIVGDPACKNEPELATKTNWDASKNLFQLAVKNKVARFIFASTCSNYGKMDGDGYVDENSPLSPVSLYAELKVKFEKFMLEESEKLDWFAPTALRFSTVYGISPRMRFDLTVNEFTKELCVGKELVIFGEQFWRPYCHVRDFARAFLCVMNSPAEKVAYNVFNVGNTNENYTKKMLADALQEKFPEAKISYVKKDEDPRDYRVNSDKIKNELGFEISATVADGIEEIMEAINSGVISNPEDQKYYNIPHKG